MQGITVIVEAVHLPSPPAVAYRAARRIAAYAAYHFRNRITTLNRAIQFSPLFAFSPFSFPVMELAGATSRARKLQTGWRYGVLPSGQHHQQLQSC